MSEENPPATAMPTETTEAPAAEVIGENAVAVPSAPALADELLDILVCPLTRSRLRQDGDWLVATSPQDAGLRYPIRNGIPVLLADEATLPDGITSLDEFKRQYAQAIPG